MLENTHCGTIHIFVFALGFIHLLKKKSNFLRVDNRMLLKFKRFFCRLIKGERELRGFGDCKTPACERLHMLQALRYIMRGSGPPAFAPAKMSFAMFVSWLVFWNPPDRDTME